MIIEGRERIVAEEASAIWAHDLETFRWRRPAKVDTLVVMTPSLRRLTLVAVVATVLGGAACSSTSATTSDASITTDAADADDVDEAAADTGDDTDDGFVADDTATSPDCPPAWTAPPDGSIAGSPECIAFCKHINKICPGLPLPCVPSKDCARSVSGACTAAQRALVACETETDLVTCHTSPPGWGSSGSSCPGFDELCDVCP